MTTIILDIDDRTMSRVAAVAQARKTSVEELLTSQVENIARLAPIELDNPGHRELLAPLHPSYSATMSEREQDNDRPLARAEAYAENRARLLRLIDSTEGDIGQQRWDRSRLYDR